jgi:hypothetical protein
VSSHAKIRTGFSSGNQFKFQEKLAISQSGFHFLALDGRFCKKMAK